MTQLPTDGSYLSDVDKSLFLDEYGGSVEVQFAKASIMRQFVNIRTVRGTDTIVNNRMGKTKLKKVVAGVRPEADKTSFGKSTLTVDTIVLARDVRSALNEFQSHIDARIELGKDHGKEIGKFFDEAHIIQCIKGAGMAAPTDVDSIGAGKSVTLDVAGAEDDPDKLEAAIESIITDMEEEDIDVEDLVILVSPKRYSVLKNNNKLMSRDYSSGNGDYAKGVIYELAGARIVKTSRIPKTVVNDHFLSNADNGNAYDITAEEANTVAVIMHPKSLLAGETIPLTSDIYWSAKDLTWFIDSYIAFGVSVNRQDVCGRVLKKTA